MRKKATILIIFLSFNLFSQDIETITKLLHKKLDSTALSSEKITILLDLANLYLPKSPLKALEYLKEIDKIRRKNPVPPQVLAKIYKTYGLAYFERKEYTEAINYFVKEIAELEKFATKNTIDSAKFNLATTAYNLKDYKTADKYFSALLDSTEIKSKEFLKQLYKSLYLTNKNLKNYQKSLEYFEKFLNIVNKEFLEATQNIELLTNKIEKTKNIEIQYIQTKTELITTKKVLKIKDSTLQKKDEEILRMQKDSLQKALYLSKLKEDSLLLSINLQKTEEERKRNALVIQNRNRQLFLLSLITVIIMLSAIVFLILINKLRINNKILKQQKEEITFKNKLIADSINYASIIQKNILPKIEDLKKILPCFVFFKPRDQVSGDFVWFKNLNGKILISVIDCTGHGVPGSLLSIAGNILLNEIVLVEKITSPGLILNKLHEKFKALFPYQENNLDSLNDGMDLVLCSLNLETKEMSYSCAKNNIIVITDTEYKILHSNPYSIGEIPFRPNQIINFKEEVYPLSNNDILILATDGYFDQMNNENQKIGLNSVIDVVKNHEFNKIEEELANTLEKWQQDTPQTDDILIVGIKIDF